jgi:hypothetical protein
LFEENVLRTIVARKDVIKPERAVFEVIIELLRPHAQDGAKQHQE